MNRRWIAAVVGAVAVVALGAGAVMAQTGGGNATSNTFLDRVAQKLGIESPKLQDAITSVRNEDIDAKVQSGDLTQKQADALKQRAANNPGFGPGFGQRGGHGPKGLGGEFGPNVVGEGEQQLADFLGIPKDQLSTGFKASNATLATVAAAHGKTADDLKAFITTAAKSKLDAAVKNGDLTQKVADDMLGMLTTHLDDVINHSGGGKHGWGGSKGFRFAPHGNENDGGSDATPPATAPQGGQAPGAASDF